MNIKKTIILIILGICFITALVDGYSLNYARPIQHFIPSNATNIYIIGQKTLKMNTTLTNDTAVMIKQILNTDCREIESAGMQAGCKIEQIKILKLFGVQITQNTFLPSNPITPTPNRICYPYTNPKYVQLNFNESNIVFFDDYKEFPMVFNLIYYVPITFNDSDGNTYNVYNITNTTYYNFKGIKIYIKNNFNNSIYVNY